MTSSASPARISDGGEHDRLEARAADAVDRRGAGRVREPGLQRGLAGRRLADAGLEDLAHQHVVDLDGRGIQAGPLDGGPDRDAAELGRRDGRQRPAELADRRARGADDEGLAVGSCMARFYADSPETVRRDRLVPSAQTEVVMRSVRITHVEFPADDIERAKRILRGRRGMVIAVHGGLPPTTSSSRSATSRAARSELAARALGASVRIFITVPDLEQRATPRPPTAARWSRTSPTCRARAYVLVREPSGTEIALWQNPT